MLHQLLFPHRLAAGKFVLEEVRLGDPLTLFLSLALLGAGLILVARLRRR